MALIKNRLKRSFSQIPNQLIVDNNLSNGAFRVMVYLLSKPDGWKVYNNDIKKQLKISKAHTIAKYWKELELTGWISRIKTSKGSYDYTLNESPTAPNGQLEEKSKCPKRATAHNGQLLKKGMHSNTDFISNTDFKENNTNNKTPTANDGSPKDKTKKIDPEFLDRQFDHLWDNSRFKKIGKEPARKSFFKLCKTRWKTVEEISEVTDLIIIDIARRFDFIGDRRSPFKNKHLSSYLNQNGWKDEETSVFES